MNVIHIGLVSGSEKNADKFEIFISGAYKSSHRPIQHVCLEVDDLPSFLQKCRRLDVHILQIQKEDSPLTFISDYDGNLFEIKKKVR
jgi:catechol 2,3-dioxygenase-like lactoylglutathione lyase family enzyme